MGNHDPYSDLLISMDVELTVGVRRNKNTS